MPGESVLAGLDPAIVCRGDRADPRFLRDWTAKAAVVPLAVIRPRTTDEVSTTLRLCHATRLPVVPQGGRTGLAGGALPLAGGVVLSLDRMSAPPVIDPVARTATVEAGVTLAALQEAAAAHGLTFPVDFGARGSCQIGGMISTNAGGIRAFRHGMTRANVLGIEAVLPDGTVIPAMAPHLKNNTGYDLKQLFIGAEGTLGIVTRAVLRLVEAEPQRAVALLLVPDVAAARQVLRVIEREPGLAALEAMWPGYWAYAQQITGLSPLSTTPTGRQIVLLAELRGWDASALHAAMMAALDRLVALDLVLDGTVAGSGQQADAFWRLREANAELYRLFPDLLGFDISLSPDRIEPLLDHISAGEPGADALWFGHMGDANLHLALTGACPGAKDRVYDAVRDLGGTISAEHGIGTEKLPWLGHSRGPAELALMRAVKATLDPHGIMNPGRLLPPGTD